MGERGKHVSCFRETKRKISSGSCLLNAKNFGRKPSLNELGVRSLCGFGGLLPDLLLLL